MHASSGCIHEPTLASAGFCPTENLGGMTASSLNAIHPWSRRCGLATCWGSYCGGFLPESVLGFVLIPYLPPGLPLGWDSEAQKSPVILSFPVACLRALEVRSWTWILGNLRRWTF